MKNQEIYKDIQKMLEELPDDYNILEEQIDLEVQMEYFELSKKMKEEQDMKDYLTGSDQLFSAEVDTDTKKEILIGLAGMDDVKAYRLLEKFLGKTGSGLRPWGVLALQESRMLLQTSLLDEQQYFISTGLGGKNKKLRYYLVFINREQDKLLTPTQQKLIRTELMFELKQRDGEFESIDFSEGFCASMVLLPLTVDLQQTFRKVMEECNQYGHFLEEDMIITNVKVLSKNEILDIIHKKNSPELPPDEEEEEE